MELLDNGIIAHSTSPYSSPVWVVPKKTDASGKRKIRVVIDYRKLNEKTIEDKYPIPQIEEILDNLGKSSYFTTLDLKSGFHQIEMDPKDRMKTAFSTTQGHFEFARMPFGLKNAPAAFQRAMNSVLSGLIGNICFVYLDDIIVVGKNLKTHLDNLDTVLQRLSDFNLKIQLDKCEFLKRETEFLGHTITPEGIKPNPDKIAKILDWRLPTTQKEIKQFLGLTGYYRRFIRDYAKLTKPLSKCLKKDATVNFNQEEYRTSFEELKKIISSDQILIYPDFKLPFILTTDASNYALGAVLSQMQDGKERPIAFGSRTLNETESNYSTTEKEALAIIWAVQKYKPYLYGNKFTLITDHKPLTFIKTSTKNSKILRWRLELENFDYDIQYKEGKANVVADALSRKVNSSSDSNTNKNLSFTGIENQPHKKENTEENITVNLEESLFVSGGQDENNPSPDNSPNNPNSDSQTIHSADTSDDYYIHFSERPINYYRNQIIFRTSRITTDITEAPFPGFNRTIICKPYHDELTIMDSFKRYHNGKQTAIMAPENLIQLIQSVYRQHFNQRGHFVLTQLQVEDVTNQERQDRIVSKEHERAHRGITEVEHQLRRSYFFPKMTNKIKAITHLCKVCNTHKYERKPYNIKLSPRPTTNRPFDRVHMDIFQIDKCNFLSLVDSFSKHLQLIPMATKNITDVKNALAQYFATYNTPSQIITDHETTFRSLQLKNYLDNLNIELSYVSCSESNGQVEKTHSTIIEIFNTNKSKFTDMSTIEKMLLSVSLYNNSVHSATKYTP
uniref:RNA-directed DNA polymerase n=1 Tax=Anopheles atroparvus TaxID=41427 RepID=A0AAG5DT40_ANOAO